jgi:hypothetical protein
VSFEIACAAVRCASENNLGRHIDPAHVESVVRSVVWDPSYAPIRHTLEQPAVNLR